MIMGQITQPQNNGLQPSQNLHYEVDSRMVELSIELPSSFSYIVQKVIQEIASFYVNSKEMAMEKYVMACVDLRFNKLDMVDELAFHQEKSIFEVLKANPTRLQDLPWQELKTKESFFRLVKEIERQYYLQTLLQDVFKQSQDINETLMDLKSDCLTLRKTLPFDQHQCLHLQGQLLKRLFYRYYENVFKIYANSDYKQRLLTFHREIGMLLCQIIEKDYFQREELFELLYCMVFINKQQKGVVGKLDYLRSKYYRFCLEKRYVINVGEERLKVYHSTARLYVDQLYKSSLKEAEDPQIESGNECLIPVRTFPIQRVKERQKYK